MKMTTSPLILAIQQTTGPTRYPRSWARSRENEAQPRSIKKLFPEAFDRKEPLHDINETCHPNND